jgi:hypothetical protein
VSDAKDDLTEVPRRWVPDLLRINLNILERNIRKDLLSARARNTLRREHLEHALAEIKRARKELARNPDGAVLAASVSMAYQLWLLPDVESATRHYRASKKGKAHQQVAATKLHQKIRTRAATLGDDKSDSAKARILAHSFPLSARQIRRIIHK